MHLAVVLNIARRWHAARAAGNERRERAFAGSLQAIGRGEVVLAAAMSEPGPGPHAAAHARRAHARRAGAIDGHKIFCTMSPAATTLLTSVRYAADDDGGEWFGYARDPSGHARRARQRRLGRARHARLRQPLRHVRGRRAAAGGACAAGFPTGELAPYLERNLDSGLFHAVGVARHRRGARSPRRRGRSGSATTPRARMLVAESVIDLSASRAALARAALA